MIFWLLMVNLIGTVPETAQPSFDDTGAWLQYASPEEAGYDSAELDNVFAQAEAGNTAALMVIVDGRVLVAWGLVDSRYKCHSVRKSIYSALIGMAHDEGKLELDQTLAELGIEDLHGLSDIERQATVRHLISARSGVYHPASKEPVSMKQNRPERGLHQPGSHFFYNNWDFNTCAMILEQKTGEELFDLFQERLADPLGMEDFRPEDAFHEYDRSASKFPAHAFRLSARDLARFGLLYLQRGMWNGRRMLSEDWIVESTSAISSEGMRSYGYMWWVFDSKASDGRPIYAASGTGGQMIIVDEAANMVVVHRGDTDHNRHARTREILSLMEQIKAARKSQPAKDPQLVTMSARDLAGRLPATPVPNIIDVEPDVLTGKVGRYRMPDGVVVSVRALDDRLVGAHPMLGEVDLFPISTSRFQAYNQNVLVSFASGESGQKETVVLEMNGNRIPLEPVAD